MTFFYFINCCALTYGPYALIYKNSVLTEYQPYRVSFLLWNLIRVNFQEMSFCGVNVYNDSHAADVSVGNYCTDYWSRRNRARCCAASC